MKLNIAERITLLSILPVEGSIVALRILNELRNALGFTEQEIKKFGIKNTVSPEGGALITWNPAMTNVSKDVEIGEVARGIIVSRLKELDGMQRLHVSMVPIYEKFVEAGGKS